MRQTWLECHLERGAEEREQQRKLGTADIARWVITESLHDRVPCKNARAKCARRVPSPELSRLGGVVQRPRRSTPFRRSMSPCQANPGARVDLRNAVDVGIIFLPRSAALRLAHCTAQRSRNTYRTQVCPPGRGLGVGGRVLALLEDNCGPPATPISYPSVGRSTDCIR